MVQCSKCKLKIYAFKMLYPQMTCMKPCIKMCTLRNQTFQHSRQGGLTLFTLLSETKMASFDPYMPALARNSVQSKGILFYIKYTSVHWYDLHYFHFCTRVPLLHIQNYVPSTSKYTFISLAAVPQAHASWARWGSGLLLLLRHGRTTHIGAWTCGPR